MIPLSKIYATIDHFNIFLRDISSDEEVQLNEYIDHLDKLNQSGDYEAWMQSRWSEPLWWVAAAILYNNMTLQRIKDGKFRDHQVKKINANSTIKSKVRFKRLMVEAWFDYCVQHSVDPRIFQKALDVGVDYKS